MPFVAEKSGKSPSPGKQVRKASPCSPRTQKGRQGDKVQFGDGFDER